MKKLLSILLPLCLMCLFAISCSKSEAVQNDLQGSIAIDDPLDEVQTKALTMGALVDVDLTEMSSTMVYAEVYNILTNPANYMGKTIKMRGPYYASYYTETDQYYHYVVIEDAAACCQQGLEFLWSGEHSYPGDYPAEQTKIEVIGIFGSYEELGQTYYYLAVDDITILNK